MIVIERLTILSLSQLFRARNSCSCGRILLLNRGRLILRLAQAFGIEMLPMRNKGKASVIASFLSLQVASAMLKTIAIGSRAQRALQIFFKDEDILLAFRKVFVQWVEEKIGDYHAAVYEASERGCGIVTFIPSDHQSYHLLHCWKNIQQDVSPDRLEIRRSKLNFGYAALISYFYSCMAGGVLLAKALTILVHQGIMLRSPKRHQYLVASHNYWTVSAGRPWDLRSADFLVDGNRIRREDILVIVSRSEEKGHQSRHYTDAGIACANLYGPPIPIRSLKTISLRLLKVALMLWGPDVAAEDVLCRRVVGSILYGLNLEIFLSHYAVGVLLNCEPQSHRHIIETVVLNRFGGRTAWIPHTIAMRTGHAAAHVYYNLFPAQGSFLVDLYSKTWSPKTVIKSIGIPSNDGSLLSSEDLATAKVRKLVDTLKANYRIVGAFTGTYTRDEFVIERYRRFLRVLVTLTEHDHTLRVVLKPKARTERCSFLYEQPFHSILKNALCEQTIVILDPADGYSCTAQYLINASQVVVSTGQYAAFGSIWVEALLLNKPSYVFAPQIFRLSPIAERFFDRWFFDEEDTLVAAVLKAADSGATHEQDPDVREWFDPFNDGRAIERFRDEVLKLAPIRD